MRTHPNHRLLTVATHLEHTALLVALALRHITLEQYVLDGYPTSTMSDGTPTGSAELTSVERAANARIALGAQRSQIDDDIDAIEQLSRSLAAVCTLTLGTRAPRFDVPMCDGRAFDGAAVAWVPHSRHPDNGWHDPACRDAADESGLCPRCRLRERRYRDEHGLAHRATNAAAGVATVAA